MTLGARLRALRQQAGLSQRELADGLVNKSMISQIESDRVQPSRELLLQLARRLGADSDLLLPAKLDDQERLARYKRAQAFFTLHHYAQALPILEDCLPISHPAWTPYDLHFQIAVCYQRLEQPVLALPHYEAALEIAIRQDRADDVYDLYKRLGEAAVLCERWALALHWLMHAYQISEPDLQRLTLCVGLARAHQALGQEEQAERFWVEAARWNDERPHRLGSTRTRAEIAAGLGGRFLAQGKLQEAEEQLQVAQALYEQCGLPEMALQVRVQRGVLLCQQGQHHAGFLWLEACRAHAAQSGDPSLQAEILREMAVIRRGEGQLLEVISLLEEALQTVAGISGELSTRLLARLNYEYADALAAAELWMKAREQAEQAVGLLQEHRLQRELLAAYRLLSTIAKQLGDYKQASEYLTQSQALFTQQIGWWTSKSLRTIP
ncbi:helix-turn-helix domain-containing protein [Tumebacillus permanentifrigoris]|uniref:Transcriptional regulator with XRE-family HTH domain n=1 Tax=Tumebacillus permanentifrigoris TaxID=378543 RepID=A0A316DAQ9_9BACL|nr:helix-turn-helix domain-containing protein [Tumebacillus permanentifrigoris]PWK14389.1 transcriptional regulator with XRE-family HTH domain [Tumebacillus permanentifrigoris]